MGATDLFLFVHGSVSGMALATGSVSERFLGKTGG